MLSGVCILLQRIYITIQDDIRADPTIGYVLVLSFFMAGFWFWWRVPNFAAADEYSRTLRPMKAAGYFISDPGFESLVRGTTEGVASDATFYFHGFLLVFVFIIVLFTGKLDTFAGFAGIESRFTLWQSVPEWYWTVSLVIIRFANVLLVVSIVYTVYRIAVTIEGRRAGRLSAVFTTLSLAVIHTAHEANEDTPMLFLLLVVLYLSLRYLDGAEDRYFLLGCWLGGMAIAFKLTGGVTVFFLGSAFIFRQVDSLQPVDRLIQRLWRPRILSIGLLLGFLAIYIGKPNLLFLGPEWFLERYGQAFTRKTAGTTTDNPMGYVALLRYLNALGLPLTLAVGGGMIAGLRRCLWRREDRQGELVIFIGIGIYLVLYFILWQDFKTHHILPSVPLLLLPLGITLARQLDDGDRIARIALIVVLLTTVLYAGGGVYQFTNDPRDEATAWLESETDSDATMTIYENSVADLGIVHGQNIDRYDFVEEPGVSGSIVNDTSYTEWMLSTPEREPEYIQVLGTSALHNPDQYPKRAAFKQRLLYGDHFGYVVAAEFGQQPQERSRIERLLRAGVVPSPEKRAGYVVILAQNETLR